MCLSVAHICFDGTVSIVLFPEETKSKEGFECCWGVDEGFQWVKRVYSFIRTLSVLSWNIVENK